ncbi:metal-dependent hydrolase [Desmospora profundinema]|uniref:Inner membrane protein n=1 Tax=Desmospora profundinema TaxID=1571184 RepID=A0ABU1IPE3_9BACL|nr:metal-dependent hydrolase [Desmospora profundinema]MDR6225824.1 inner membrane protein [Desmospora profundinema]
MDTGTHFLMGVGLFGLAHLDPAVAQSEMTAQAVLLGTMIGSQAPDLDTLYRFKGNTTYVRNHRGWSHSIPMWFLWPLLISAGITLFWEPVSFLSLLGWTGLAVLTHVAVDLFNSYGTQALRPFSNRWIRWHVLPIIDPVIITLHLTGFGLWAWSSMPPGPLFAGLYAMLAGYIAVRRWLRLRQTRQITADAQPDERLVLLPTMRIGCWQVIGEGTEKIRFGRLEKETLTWEQEVSKAAIHHPAAQASLAHPAIRFFYDFCDHRFVKVEPSSIGWEVRWSDARDHRHGEFPFQAIAWIDLQHKVLDASIGWLSTKSVQRRRTHLQSLNNRG